MPVASAWGMHAPQAMRQIVTEVSVGQRMHPEQYLERSA